MAAVMGRTELGIREFGNTVTIPADPRAKLMYYLDCMCTVLDLSGRENLARLRDFRNYFLLTEGEVDALLALTVLLSPNTLEGKVIFCDPEMCGNKTNTFFELSAVERNLLISDNILIGGQRTAVKKIMAYTPQWLLQNWRYPMMGYTNRIARLATGQPTAQRPAIGYSTFPRQQYNSNSRNTDSCCCCTIL